VKASRGTAAATSAASDSTGSVVGWLEAWVVATGDEGVSAGDWPWPQAAKLREAITAAPVRAIHLPRRVHLGPSRSLVALEVAKKLFVLRREITRVSFLFEGLGDLRRSSTA
jgi:hypothetical protein